MRLLLDTHTLLWWWDDHSNLSATARELIADPENEVLVSAATSWEIATKYRLGRPNFGADAYHRHDELLAGDGFAALPISTAHNLRAGSYPMPHKDPFDRMLVAQSKLENVPLVSRDPQLAAFPRRLIW